MRGLKAVGDGGDVLMSIDRVARSVVLDARWSHDEIRTSPERSRECNPERRDRAKKLETSTKVNVEPPVSPKDRFDILVLTASIAGGQ